MSKARKSKKHTSKERNAKSKPTAEELKAQRDAALAPVVVKIEGDEDGRAVKRQRLDELLPQPAGFQGYPTLQELTLYIDKSPLTETALSQEDIQALLDVLCYDKRVVRIPLADGYGYKALRRTVEEIEDGPQNGLTEAPCGRCPVLDLCEEGGPVGPSNCPYFQKWLNPSQF